MYALIINVPVLLAGIWVFMKKMRDCIPTLRFVTYTATKNVLSLGMVFFMCQIFYAMIMNTDQFLITKFYGPLYTADYTFYYRVVMFFGYCINIGINSDLGCSNQSLSRKRL